MTPSVASTLWKAARTAHSTRRCAFAGKPILNLPRFSHIDSVSCDIPSQRYYKVSNASNVADYDGGRHFGVEEE